MAVSQISISDSDITSTHNAPQNQSHVQPEKKEAPNKKLESQPSMNMDELMGNLTSSNTSQKPAAKNNFFGKK